MPSAMVHRNGMVFRHLIEVLYIHQAFVLYLGIIEKVSLYPGAGRSLSSFLPKFLDDTFNRNKFYFKRISNQYLVKQHLATCMIMTVDKARHHGHLLCVECLSAFS